MLYVNKYIPIIFVILVIIVIGAVFFHKNMKTQKENMINNEYRSIYDNNLDYISKIVVFQILFPSYIAENLNFDESSIFVDETKMK